METLVLPAEDQFVRQRDKADRRNASSKKIFQEKPRSLESEKSFASHQVNLLQNETSCSFSPVLPKPCRSLKPALPASAASLPLFPSPQGFAEGYSGPPGRKWHSMPCNLPGEGIISSFQERDGDVGVPPFPFQFRQTKHENGRSCSRSDAKNRKRTTSRSKPLDIGTHKSKVASSPEGNTFVASPWEVKMKKDSCAFSPPISVTENWAGPAYSCSPPPSSLPFPKFSLQQRRCVSLELPPAGGEFSEAISDASLLVSSQSAPASPSGKAPIIVQDFGLDVVSATKDLRRILNLDFDD